MKKKRYLVSAKTFQLFFAVLMSSVTSSVVSGLTIIITKGITSDFFYLWLKSFIRAWPIVFISILIFVPLINSLLSSLFKKETKNKKND